MRTPLRKPQINYPTLSDAAIGAFRFKQAFFQTIENSRENRTDLSNCKEHHGRFPEINGDDPNPSQPQMRKSIHYTAVEHKLNKMPNLFEPLTIRSVSFPNRVFVSPMCQYSSEDGFANDWHLVHLGARAVGRAGLVFTEATAVTPEGRISPQDLGIWKDDHLEFLGRIVEFIHSQGTFAGMQLAHAGRKASTAVPWKGGTPIGPDEGGWSPIYAPSDIPFAPGYQTPSAMSIEQIQQTVVAFKAAAQRALAAGFDVVEIHAAHGYLLHEFLSPLSNKRDDQYGGKFENRARMVCEVATAIRQIWPDRLPLFIRISSTDWVQGGWDIEQSVELARKLQPLGVDLVDCSSGGLIANAVIPVGPGYQTHFAERIRREAAVLSASVGMITSPQQADTIVRTGQADAVLLAREFLRHPYWPLHAARAVHQKITWPQQYDRARD